MTFRLHDFDDAYANAPHIADAGKFAPAWTAAAASFRADMLAAGRARLDAVYGEKPRNRFDLFLPEGAARGLVVFVHGGFWKAFDRSVWSHLAGGALALRHAVAMPSYTLCPDANIADIAVEVSHAISRAAEEVDGPLTLVGHSAGGQIVTRLIATGTPLAEVALARVSRVVSISGVHDVRPIMRTAMNDILRIDEDTARRESPALLRPVRDVPVTCWVGGAERAEFRRQSRLLADIWGGLGAEIDCVEEPDRHHFDIVDGLAVAGHPLARLLVAPA